MRPTAEVWIGGGFGGGGGGKRRALRFPPHHFCFLVFVLFRQIKIEAKKEKMFAFSTHGFFCFGHTLAPMYRIVFFVYVVVRSSSNVVVVVMVMMAGVDGGTLLHRFWFTLLSSTLFSGGEGGFRVGDWGSLPFFICPYHSSSSSSRRRGSSMQKKKLLAFCWRPFQGCFGEGKTK